MKTCGIVLTNRSGKEGDSNNLPFCHKKAKGKLAVCLYAIVRERGAGPKEGTLIINQARNLSNMGEDGGGELRLGEKEICSLCISLVSQQKTNGRGGRGRASTGKKKGKASEEKTNLIAERGSREAWLTREERCRKTL